MDAKPVYSRWFPADLAERLSAGLRLWPYFLAAAAVLIPLMVQVLVRRETTWDNCYLLAARELWEGRDLYDSKTTYVYPPFMAWLCVPLLSWPLWLSRALIYLVNVGFVAFVVRAAWKLSGGTTLASRREHTIFLLGLASGFLYMFNCLSYLQSDLFIAALVFGSCLLLQQDRPLAAATLLGLAAGAKCTPLLWLAYFVWRMEWRAALWLAVVAVGVNLLPDITCPAPDGMWLSIWFQRFLAPLASAQQKVGEWHSMLLYNQSIQGAVARLFFYDPIWQGTDLAQTPRAVTLPPQLVKKAVLLGELTLMAICFLTMRFGARKAESPGNTGVPRSAFEMSIVMILMLMLSPMSSKYHFGLLILPGFALARLTLTSGNRIAAVLFGLSLVCVLFVPKFPWGTTIYSYALWHSVVLGQAFLVLAACLAALWSERRMKNGKPIASNVQA